MSRRIGPRRAGAARLHVFVDSERFGRDLGRAAGLELERVAVHRFPDGESLVRVGATAGMHAVLVRSLHDPNAKLVETVLAADALRRAGARRVTLIAPYLPYMRQDRMFETGEPVSQRVIGAWLRNSFDRVLTLEAHLHRIRRLADVMGRGSRSLSAAPAISAWLRRAGGARNCLVVGPDGESAPWVRAIARAAGAPWVVGVKERFADRSVRITLPSLPACRRALIVDDIASSGVTLAVAARALRERRVRVVDALVVHAIFAPGALERIRAAGVRRMISCDTIPHQTNRIATAPIFAPVLVRRSPQAGRGRVSSGVEEGGERCSD